jgi:formylglycine-generating enzyme required for sulfatase activity
MEADDSWAFYIRTSEHFLQTAERDSGEVVSAILAEADDLRKVGDGLGGLIVKWESIHEPVKLPKTWSRTPADLVGLAEEYNERVTGIEEALQGEALKLEALGEALGSPVWRRGILKKMEQAESEVSEITEHLLKLFRDVPNELGRVKVGAASGSPEASAAVASLETAVAEVTESFLKSAKAEDLSLERMQSLLSNAGKAAFAAIRSAEQALEELKAAEDQQRQKKDEEKPAKKTTKKAVAKSNSVELQAPAAPATWFYLNDANEAQQADLSVLADLIKDNILTQQSHVWREGWAEWREMGQVEELAKLFGSNLAKSPPPMPGGSTLRAGETAVFGGIEFVWCPPGSFLMGCPKDELGSGYHSTQHQVILTRGFWMGKFPVTQGQWEVVMGGNPSHFKDSGPNAPVEQVSWDDAQEFCRALNQHDGREYRLPTEAEWEYACRAGTARAWGFNEGDYVDNDILEKDGIDYEETLPNYAWFEDNSKGTTHPVGQKKSNAWGLHDMHGNVDEWCQDYWTEEDYPQGSATDPIGPVIGSKRGFRGGAWDSNYEYNRSASRWGTEPTSRTNMTGFRLALWSP